MADTSFSVKYDGPALQAGRMPVRDLAPALLALGDLFADAGLVVYPDRKPVALSIQATEEGSFIVRLILESGDRMIDLFGSDAVSALINLKELILMSGGGLFWLIKRLRGRRIVSRQEDPLSGVIRLALDDGTTIEVPAALLGLYQHVEIRKKAREVVKPLEREGVNRLEFINEQAVTVTVEASEVDAFDVPEIDEVVLSDQEIPMVVSIAAVAFVEGNKWRLSDGERTFHASIEDPEFLSRVQHGVEAFRKGDMLRVRMKIVQSKRIDGLHTEYEVPEVLEHIPGAMQLELGDEHEAG